MTTHTPRDTSGYYLVSISSSRPAGVASSNNERAFIIAQLQDLLSPRSRIGTAQRYREPSSHIDLLAYSIMRKEVSFVLYSISYPSARWLADMTSSALHEYQTSYGALVPDTYIVIKKLAGVHHALQKSVVLHARHADWEYDRYSSIGFYLHDRRGDWMRLWRLSALFENEPELYRKLIEAHLPSSYEFDSSFARPSMA